MMAQKLSDNVMLSQYFDGNKLKQVWGLVALLTLAVFAVRVGYLVLWHPYGLAPDEAQYWSWLQHNDWSFLTKPPLTTWLMGLFCLVFGNTLLGVKFFALVGQGLVSLLGFAIAKELGGRKAGWWAWSLFTTAPLIAAGGLIMSPDAVLLPIWMGAMLLVVRGLGKAEDKALCWERWITIGVLIGLGGLAKYSAAFFYPLLGVYLLVWRREWLMQPQVYVSGLIALVMQAPVLIWNMQHHGVGIEHVLWQAAGSGDDFDGSFRSFAQFIGGQALVLGPVVFGLMVMALGKVALPGWRVSGVAGVRWMVVSTVLILAGFGVLAFTTKVQANWPILGAVGGLLVLAVWLGQVRAKWVLWVAVGGIMLNSLLSVMLMDTYGMRALHILPLKAKIDPTKDLRGWQDMGQLVGLMMYKLDNPVILSSRYQTLAPLMFHTIGKPEFAYVNADGRRLNEYDLWPLPDLNGRLVVYVNESGNLPAKIKGMFGSCEAWHTLGVEEYGIQTRRLSMWLCWGANRTVAMN